MIVDFNLENFISQKYIGREELVKEIKEQFGYNNEATIRWRIYELVKLKKITKIDDEYFFNGYLKEYHPSTESEVKISIINFLEKKFPLLEIVIFESTILNEWLNHQVSKNIIIVQVDKHYIDGVFKEIKENTANLVLLEPSLDDFYLYAENDTIIVSNMVTRSPINLNGYDIKLEKLMVDIFSNDLIGEFISPSEYENFISEIFMQYKINAKKVLTYAKRRSIYDDIYKCIETYLPKENRKK